MTRQHINTGTYANDGTGDTLRQTGNKINANFIEIYTVLGGDSNTLYGNVRFGNGVITFEGLQVDDYQTVLGLTEPTKDNLILLPDSSGEVVITTAEQEIYNKHLYNVKIDGDLRLHGVSGTGYYHLHYEGQVDSGTDLIINLPDLQDSDTIVFESHLQTLTNKTLTNPIIVDPRIDSDLYDALGNKVLSLPATSAAVNRVVIRGAALGNQPSISVDGDEDNIDLFLNAKGNGQVRVNSPIRFSDSDYTVNGVITKERNISLFTPGGNLAMTMENGRQGQVMHLLNLTSYNIVITPDTFGYGNTFSPAKTTFTLNDFASITAIYNTETNGGAEVGWYLIGLDSDLGLGSKVTIA